MSADGAIKRWSNNIIQFLLNNIFIVFSVLISFYLMIGIFNGDVVDDLKWLTVFLPVVVIVIVAVALGAAAFKKAKEVTSEEDAEKSIIYQVPKNHRWILRNVWFSDPVNGDGYEEKKEGWRFYIPKIWHSDEGVVDMTPVQLDVEPFKVNCTDGNDVDIDARVTYFIEEEEGSAIKYHINTKNDSEKVKDLVTQRVKVALNRAVDKDSNVVISWSAEDKVTYSDLVTAKANELLRDDSGKDYGLKAVINVENIEPTPAVKAATDRKKAAELEKDAADDEAAAMAKMITATGANPTWVMVAQTVSDALRGLGGKKND